MRLGIWYFYFYRINCFRNRKHVPYCVLFEIKQTIPVLCWVPSMLRNGLSKSHFTYSISVTDTTTQHVNPKRLLDVRQEVQIWCMRCIYRVGVNIWGGMCTFGAGGTTVGQGMKTSYRKISNISRTKSQNLDVSPLVMQLSSPNSMKPDVKSRMKIKLEHRRQAMLQLHLSDRQFYCLLRCTLC